MYFNLFNALVKFKDSINKILTQKFVIIVIFYLNNIFIYIKDKDQSYIDIV